MPFQKKILDRYTHHKRDLPRRDTFDQYKVLVSEIMLQQTQVDRVIPKFAAFMYTFPTLQDLADAPKELLLRHRS
jgi:A/G-specific adenine glycosylase